MAKGQKEVLFDVYERWENKEDELNAYEINVYSTLQIGKRYKVTRYLDENGEVQRVSMSISTGWKKHNPASFAKSYITWDVSFISIWRGRGGAVYRTGNMNGNYTSKKVFTSLLLTSKLRSITADGRLNAQRGSNSECKRVFASEVEKTFPEIPKFSELFPLAQHYGAHEYNYVPVGLRSAMIRAENVQEFTRRAFGKTRYRRDLVKAVASATLQDVENAWQFRGLVPIDWIVDLLRGRQWEGRNARQNAISIPRRHLKHLDQRSLRRLMGEMKERNYDYGFSQQIADIDFVSVEYPILTRVDSWKDLHDRLIALDRPRLLQVAERREAKVQRMLKEMDFWSLQADLLSDEKWCAENPELAASPQLRKERRAELEAQAEVAREAVIARQERERLERVARQQRELEERHKAAMEKRRAIVAALDGKHEEFRITVAKREDVLLQWGSEMNNCIASYRDQVNSPIRVLGGVYRGKQLLGNFELSYAEDQFVLRQLLGKYNRALDNKVREVLVQRFAGVGVATNKGYWGES